MRASRLHQIWREAEHHIQSMPVVVRGEGWIGPLEEGTDLVFADNHAAPANDVLRIYGVTAAVIFVGLEIALHGLIAIGRHVTPARIVDIAERVSNGCSQFQQ